MTTSTVTVERFEHPRRKDWAIRWVEFIKDSMDIASDLVLDWDSEGVTCYSWVGSGVEAITGYDPHEQFEGRYNSVLSVCKLIKALGYSSMDEVIATQFKEVPVSMSQSGDIVLVSTVYQADSDSDEATVQTAMPHGVALVDPPFYYAVTENGLVKGDLYTHGVRAFAVGRKV